MTTIKATNIQTIFLKGQRPGASVWISSQIHGNEASGSLAIDRVLHEINQGIITLDSGQILFVPRLNIAAGDRRFEFSDVNRRVIPDQGKHVENREDFLRQAIVRELSAFCARPFGLLSGPPPKRYVVDLHSFHTVGQPHAWVYTHRHKDGDSLQLALATGVSRILCGWVKAYQSVINATELTAAKVDHYRGETWWTPVVGRVFPDYARTLATRNELANMATTLGQRAFNLGATAITVESGQHKDPQAVEFAYRAIRGVLAHAGITAPYDGLANGKREVDLLTVRNVHFRLDGDQLAKDFDDLEPVHAAQVIIDGKRRIEAPLPQSGETGHVLFPNPHAAIGREIVYYATSRRSVAAYG